jgi:hypothetical protein
MAALQYLAAVCIKQQKVIIASDMVAENKFYTVAS